MHGAIEILPGYNTHRASGAVAGTFVFRDGDMQSRGMVTPITPIIPSGLVPGYIPCCGFFVFSRHLSGRTMRYLWRIPIQASISNERVLLTTAVS